MSNQFGQRYALSARKDMHTAHSIFNYDNKYTYLIIVKSYHFMLTAFIKMTLKTTFYQRHYATKCTLQRVVADCPAFLFFLTLTLNYPHLP